MIESELRVELGMDGMGKEWRPKRAVNSLVFWPSSARTNKQKKKSRHVSTLWAHSIDGMNTCGCDLFVRSTSHAHKSTIETLDGILFVLFYYHCVFVLLPAPRQVHASKSPGRVRRKGLVGTFGEACKLRQLINWAMVGRGIYNLETKADRSLITFDG